MLKTSNIALVFFATTIAVFMSEAVARVFLTPVDFLLPEMESHPTLNHRIKANSAGHDSLGFRNLEIPEDIDVVTIGDSMTYGVAATHQGAWPYQLAQISGANVYNMALGGYGPIHYLYLMREHALQMSPEQIVLGLYLGNDIRDSYNLVYSNNLWKELRRSDSPDSVDPADLIHNETSPDKHFAELRDWLSRNSVLYRAITQSFVSNAVRRLEFESSNPDLIEIRVPGGSTFLTPEARLVAMDLEDSRVREGMELSLWAISEMASLCEVAGVKLLVLLIPTKEKVYQDHIQGLAIELNDSAYSRLLEVEEQLVEQLTSMLKSQGIPYLDVSQALSVGARNEDIFPQNDGHPNAKGYAIIAGEVARVLGNTH